VKLLDTTHRPPINKKIFLNYPPGARLLPPYIAGNTLKHAMQSDSGEV
jgi:hypothetical protein